MITSVFEDARGERFAAPDANILVHVGDWWREK
jgi:hypothetical protein